MQSSETLISAGNEPTDLNTKNAKITRAILEWYESWQTWQKKILITGIISRYEYNQLRGLLMAVESVFHKDFATTVKKVFPVSGDIGKDSLHECKQENTFVTSKDVVKKAKKKVVDDDLKSVDESHSFHEHGEVIRIPSPVYIPQGARSRTASGSEGGLDSSHVLSPIAEGEGGLSEAPPSGMETGGEDIIENISDIAIEGNQDFSGVARTAMLISHLMNEAQSPNTSQVSTLVSSLSPIEETSPESTVSGGSETLLGFLPPLKPPSDEASADRVPSERLKSKDTGKKGKVKRKRRKTKKHQKSIPENVVKKIASFSALVNRPVSSNVSLTPLGMESSLSLDFHSGVTSVQVQPDEFFNKNNAQGILGQPVTTLSKLGMQFKDDYDFSRNDVPIPTTQQLYKSKKLWTRDTIETNVGRLKELFREQLNQIWQWLNDWPSYQRTRLLLQLFSKSSQKMVQFAAECLKVKKQEADDLPPPIEMLSDALLLKIFGHLTTQELLDASYVCKRWYSILNSDDLWKTKCDEIGLVFGINNLAQLLAGGAEANQALDWKQAFIEVHQYLTMNLEPIQDESSSSSEESEESEPEEEDRFPDYIPYWKTHPPEEMRRKSVKPEVIKQDLEAQVPSDPVLANLKEIQSEGRTPQNKGGFLQMWKNITEDIKEDFNLNDARSDACYDADMFADIQSWDDVGLLTNIGQKFAVDYIIKESMEACSRNWPIEDHVKTVNKVRIFKAHSGAVNVVKAQGNRIFSGSSDRCIRVWDRSGQCFAKMTESLKGGINDISIGDADEPKVMYTASWDMSIRAWNTVNFRLKGTLTGHRGSVRKVAADNKFIVSCSHDGTIKVWDRKKWKCERTITCHSKAVECMIYHDRLIISGGVDKKICVSNSFTGRLIRTFLGHKTPITALKKQHDLLASGDMEGNLYFWSMVSDDNEPVDKIKAHESQINAIDMHGPTFFTASKDALVKEWDLVTMTPVRMFQGHTDSITDVKWTEKYLLTASRDNDIRIWWWKEGQDEVESRSFNSNE